MIREAKNDNPYKLERLELLNQTPETSRQAVKIDESLIVCWLMDDPIRFGINWRFGLDAVVGLVLASATPSPHLCPYIGFGGSLPCSKVTLLRMGLNTVLTTWWDRSPSLATLRCVGNQPDERRPAQQASDRIRK